MVSRGNLRASVLRVWVMSLLHYSSVTLGLSSLGNLSTTEPASPTVTMSELTTASMEDFWVLPSGPLSTDEMAGWVSVEDENEIPLCLSENLASIPCQSSFFSFGVLSNNGTNSSGYVNGETKDGHVSRVTNFSTAVLHRYSMKGAEMLISNKNRDAYWSVNSTTGRLTAVKQDKASLFRMYKRVGGEGPVLLKTGSFYLALGDSGMYGSQVITSENMLFPAQPTYSDPVGIVDALDAEIMGSRFQSLSNGGELYPVWMAYDLALVIPLRDLPEAPDFVDFTMENATAFDLIPMFTKFFHLVANRMVKAYSHYPSLGKTLPQDLSLHQVAERVRTHDSSVWSSVSNTFIEKRHANLTDAASLFGTATFASAKFKAMMHDNRQLLSREDEKVETWMSAYYESSCTLSSRRAGVPLLEKLNLTDILVDTTNMKLLTKASGENPKSYWFSDLLTSSPNAHNGSEGNTSVQLSSSPDIVHEMDTSRVLVELGLLLHLDSELNSVNTSVGEGISAPFFVEIDKALNSSQGMNIERLTQLFSSDSTRELMEAIDVICTRKKVRSRLCVLPRIYQQMGLIGPGSRNIADSSVVTKVYPQSKSAAMGNEQFLMEPHGSSSYSIAIWTAVAFAQEVQVVSALISKCNEETYRRGGLPSEKCNEAVYSARPILTENVPELIGAPSIISPRTSSLIPRAFIPTAPSYPGDLAFINITRLMDGYPTSFRLPSDNVTWLVDHGWLANVEQAKQVTFVKAFRLFLPPRFAHYDKEPASVELVVKSHSLSDLGPARNWKKYEIPRVQYKTEYTYGAWHETPQLYERMVYHECNANLPPYCVRSRGIAQTNTDILPSLFSEWEVTAQLNGNASSIRIGYRQAVTPLLLHAQVELEHIVDQPGPIASLIDNSALPASRREQADDQVACCAEKDEYLARLGSSTVCLPCPAGSISQLGGLYCVVDPRVGG